MTTTQEIVPDALVEAAESLTSIAKIGDEDSISFFERVASDFYRDTGVLRPGKSESMAGGSGLTDEERWALWSSWCAAKWEGVKAALALPRVTIEEAEARGEARGAAKERERLATLFAAGRLAEGNSIIHDVPAFIRAQGGDNAG